MYKNALSNTKRKTLDWYHRTVIMYGLPVLSYTRNICLTPPPSICSKIKHSLHHTLLEKKQHYSQHVQLNYFHFKRYAQCISKMYNHWTYHTYIQKHLYIVQSGPARTAWGEIIVQWKIYIYTTIKRSSFRNTSPCYGVIKYAGHCFRPIHPQTTPVFPLVDSSLNNLRNIKHFIVLESFVELRLKN